MATHSQRQQQRGGTIIGFILGTLVGLAGALAVAVYVTKVPVPFVDRAISRKPAEDAAEAERNKNWNPNAALAGKPAKTATPEPVSGSMADADGKAVTKKIHADEAAARDKADMTEKTVGKTKPDATETPVSSTSPSGKNFSSDPLGDLAVAKGQGKTVSTVASKPAAAETASTDPFAYYVQVGAFRAQEDAQSQRAKLALMGLDAKISEREQSGRTVYRVRLGPYERQTDAERMKDNLQTGGLDSALVRVQR